MLVKVIKSFNDRTADLVTRVADRDILDVSDERAEELIKGGFVEKVVEKEDDDSALDQTPSETTEDSDEVTASEPESKPEPKKSSKAKKTEKKD